MDNKDAVYIEDILENIENLEYFLRDTAKEDVPDLKSKIIQTKTSE